MAIIVEIFLSPSNYLRYTHERKLSYDVFLAANSENVSFGKSPHTSDENIYKIRPGGNFDYTLPLTSRFGIVVTGAASERYTKLHYTYKTYNANAAGTGARIALLDSRSRKTIEALVGRVEKIETAIEPRFQEHFVEAMAIPHKTAAYTELRKVVTLPAARESAGTGRRGGRSHGRR